VSSICRQRGLARVHIVSMMWRRGCPGREAGARSLPCPTTLTINYADSTFAIILPMLLLPCQCLPCCPACYVRSRRLISSCGTPQFPSRRTDCSSQHVFKMVCAGSFSSPNYDAAARMHARNRPRVEGWRMDVLMGRSWQRRCNGGESHYFPDEKSHL
jgi:hypothetical protein